MTENLLLGLSRLGVGSKEKETKTDEVSPASTATPRAEAWANIPKVTLRGDEPQTPKSPGEKTPLSDFLDRKEMRTAQEEVGKFMQHSFPQPPR